MRDIPGHESILDGSIGDASKALSDGRITAVALVEASLRRIVQTPAITACFQFLDADHALQCARRVDASPGTSRGPLAGIAVAHKDLFARDGRVSTFGAHSRYHSGAASRTASLLRLLDEAGCIELGTLHMAEFAMGPAGWSETYGFIENPLAPHRVSGGSSSGSAAAVGHGAVFAALGSDTGGSIRIPAAFCGVVGLKPTAAIFSLDGVQPVSTTLDTVGPLARTVADCERMFDVLQGRGTLKDPAAPGDPDRFAPPRRRLALGVMDTSRLPTPPDAEVAAAFQRSIDALRAAGHTVEEVAVDLSELGALSAVVFLAEAAAEHLCRLQEDPCDIGPQVRDRLVQGLGYPAAYYLKALSLRDTFRAAWNKQYFDRFDALLSPTAPCLSPLRTVYAGLRSSADTLTFNSRLGAYTGYVNYLGFPALNVPIQRDAETGGIGLQVIGKDHSEPVLFSIGREIERATSTGHGAGQVHHSRRQP